MEFCGCESKTLGAEWELQLLDRKSLDLAPGISTVLDCFAGNEYVKPEFFQSCVELNSPVTACSTELSSHFLSLTREVLRICQGHDMDLAGAGTHPFCRRLALITPLPRYKMIEAEHGYIGHTQIAFATHVHVGMKSGDEAIRAMRFLTPALPLLIAISANSPFWRGHETGYASYRRRLLTASSSYGIPPYFDDWHDFERFFEMAMRAGSVETIKDIHWDIRPHPDFGTLECRVPDSQSTIADLIFVAGFVRSLLTWISSACEQEIESVLPRHISTWTDRENHFRASHWGLDAELIHDSSGTTRPVRSYLSQLSEAMAGTSMEIGEGHIPDQLMQIAPESSGYERQCRAYAERSDTHDVARSIRDRLVNELRASS